MYCLDNETYVKYANAYSGCNPWGGSRNIHLLGGTGLLGVAKEFAQGTVVA